MKLNSWKLRDLAMDRRYSAGEYTLQRLIKRTRSIWRVISLDLRGCIYISFSLLQKEGEEEVVGAICFVLPFRLAPRIIRTASLRHRHRG